MGVGERSQPLSNDAGFFKQSMGARSRVGTELSYRPARLHRHSLAELVSRNRFLGSLTVKNRALLFSSLTSKMPKEVKFFVYY